MLEYNPLTISTYYKTSEGHSRNVTVLISLVKFVIIMNYRPRNNLSSCIFFAVGVFVIAVTLPSSVCNPRLTCPLYAQVLNQEHKLHLFGFDIMLLQSQQHLLHIFSDFLHSTPTHSYVIKVTNDIRKPL